MDYLAGGSSTFTDGFKVTNNPGISAILSVIDGSTQVSKAPLPQTFATASGVGTLLMLTESAIQLLGPNTATAVSLEDGAIGEVANLMIAGFQYGLVVQDVGAGSYLNTFGITFAYTSTQLEVNSPTATGQYVGAIDITKAHINDDAPFFIRDRDNNTLIVSKKGSDFQTISSAIAFVNPIITVTTTASSNLITSSGLFNISLNNVQVQATGIIAGTTATYLNPNTMMLSVVATASGTVPAQFIRATPTNAFIITVETGTYVELPLTLPNYTSLIGVDQTLSIVQPSDNTQPLIKLGNVCAVRYLTIAEVTNSIGILVDSVQTNSLTPPGQIQGCVFIDCQTPIKCTSTVSPSECFIRDCMVQGNFTTGLLIDGTLLNTAYPVEVNTNGLSFTAPASSTCVLIEGPNASLFLNSSSLEGNNLAGVTGISVSDSATFSVASSEINDCVTGLVYTERWCRTSSTYFRRLPLVTMRPMISTSLILARQVSFRQWPSDRKCSSIRTALFQ